MFFTALSFSLFLCFYLSLHISPQKTFHIVKIVSTVEQTPKEPILNFCCLFKLRKVEGTKWKFSSPNHFAMKGCKIFQVSIPGNRWRHISRWCYPASKPETVCIKNSNSSIRKSSEDQQTITRIYCTCNGSRKWFSWIPLHDSLQVKKAQKLGTNTWIKN